MTAFYPCLWFLGFGLGTHLTPASTILDAASEITTVTQEEPPLLDGDDPNEARAGTAKLLQVWTWKETGWKNLYVEDKDGHFMGPGMVGEMWLGTVPGPWTATRTVSSRLEGFRLTLRVMAYLKTSCGSLRAGLGAYAGRKCGDAQTLVSWRLTLAGLEGAK